MEFAVTFAKEKNTHLTTEARKEASKYTQLCAHKAEKVGKPNRCRSCGVSALGSLGPLNEYWYDHITETTGAVA